MIDLASDAGCDDEDELQRRCPFANFDWLNDLEFPKFDLHNIKLVFYAIDPCVHVLAAVWRVLSAADKSALQELQDLTYANERGIVSNTHVSQQVEGGKA